MEVLGHGAFDPDIHTFVIVNFQENDFDQDLRLGAAEIGDDLTDVFGGLAIGDDINHAAIRVHVKVGGADLAVGGTINGGGAGAAAGGGARRARRATESTAARSLLSQQGKSQAAEGQNH